MTRRADETRSLRERAATANRRHGDIFVSIHLNSLRPSSARGIETYYLGPSDDSGLDAIAAAENRHSGYSLADIRRCSNTSTPTRDGTSRGGWPNRFSARSFRTLRTNGTSHRRPRREDGALRGPDRHRDARDRGRGLLPVERGRRQAAGTPPNTGKPSPRHWCLASRPLPIGHAWAQRKAKNQWQLKNMMR